MLSFIVGARQQQDREEEIDAYIRVRRTVLACKRTALNWRGAALDSRSSPFHLRHSSSPPAGDTPHDRKVLSLLIDLPKPSLISHSKVQNPTTLHSTKRFYHLSANFTATSQRIKVIFLEFVITRSDVSSSRLHSSGTYRAIGVFHDYPIFNISNYSISIEQRKLERNLIIPVVVTKCCYLSTAVSFLLVLLSLFNRTKHLLNYKEMGKKIFVIYCVLDSLVNHDSTYNKPSINMIHQTYTEL